jgi:hypothetical protein
MAGGRLISAASARIASVLTIAAMIIAAVQLRFIGCSFLRSRDLLSI